MPALQLVVRGAVVLDSVDGVLECVATPANYAERVTTELAMYVPSEKLARHSPAFGINRQTQRRRSSCLARRRACPHRRSSGVASA